METITELAELTKSTKQKDLEFKPQSVSNVILHHVTYHL